MRSFVTGGTGFIGKEVIRRLRERGDEVVALVRGRERGADLEVLGCSLIEGDVLSTQALKAGMEACDSAWHIAGVYKMGIPAAERPSMHDANVKGTASVLDAAIASGVARIVYVSTVGYFGNTKGEVVDESYERPGNDFLSYYDETKYLAHRVALDRIGSGAPVVIAMPGGVYGPGDPSELGSQLAQATTGKLPAISFPETGFNLAHVEDIAAGIILVHDKGTIGRSYVLGGEVSTMGEFLRKGAEVAGVKPPRFTMPSTMIKMSIPLAPLVTRAMGLPPNLRELIKAADGVTYWATDERARGELGYSPRDLDAGLRAYVAAVR